MKRVVSFLSVIGLSLVALLSCEKTPTEITKTYTLNYSFSSENSMYVSTKSAASDVFDEFYSKLTTGELVADTYNLKFTEIESGANYTFTGSWKGATVELQAGTYKVTGTSTALGEKTQEKCSIIFDETISVTNQMSDIVLTANYDCFLFVMTSDMIDRVDNCFKFNNKYWYAFVNGSFVNTLTGVHRDGSKFSVDMSGYSFEKGKYYVYRDISINEYGIYFLIPKMDNGYPEWDGFRLKATSENTVLVKRYDGDRYSDGKLYYSFDTQNWVLWENDSEVHLKMNQVLYLKGNNAFSGETYSIYALNGTAYASGYICSLFDNGTDYTTATIPYKALQQLFWGEEGAEIKWITGELKFPNTVKVIGTKDLYGYTCHGGWWTSVILPNELEFIGCTCFEGNNMTDITIPRTVKFIGDAAFNACRKLSTVYFTGTVAEWEAVEKGNYRWDDGIPATKIICTDGQANF